MTDHRVAIAGRLAELSGRSIDALQGHVRHFKVDAFNDDLGQLDVAAVDEYANTFGLAGPSTPATDPVRENLARRRPAGGRTGDGQSMTERRAAAASNPRGPRSKRDNLSSALAARGGRHTYTDEGNR